jgi:hypothetical protein
MVPLAPESLEGSRVAFLAGSPAKSSNGWAIQNRRRVFS